MKNYREISPEELSCSPIKLIGKDWLLITAPDATKACGANAMTASWGGLGVLWSLPVATIYVRPQRYTYSLVEAADEISLCFPSEKYRKAMGLCGTKSGRDLDKITEAGLCVDKVDGVPVIDDSEIILVCKKLYDDDIKKENFVDEHPLSHYEKNDFHRFYVLEIKKVLVKE